MAHHIVYWKMAKREVDVDDAELSELRLQERVGDLYIEFLDGQRLPLIWDHDLSSWVAAKQRARPPRDGMTRSVRDVGEERREDVEVAVDVAARWRPNRRAQPPA